jgi:alpha-beta hydrolase superfamily lysophospholipase
MIKEFLEQFLFFPNKEIKKNPSFINLDYEDIYVEHEKEKYHGWFIKGNDKNSITKNKCILFFHGNAGNICFRMNYIEKFNEMGFSMLIFDYPGFGSSTGIPNEYNCIKCSEKFYKYLIDVQNFTNKDIILYGESIGGSIAASLANIYNVKYLVLQSTFTDVKEIIKNIISFDVFMVNNIGFNTLENVIKRYKINKTSKKMKTLVIHSNDDELIDISHGEKLKEYSDSMYICSGSHSNVNIDADFIFNLLSFIKE